MKRIILLFAIVISVCASAQETTDTVRHEVLLETDKGNIRIALYNETPQHRDNFLKLVNEGFYDGLLFHRVIFRFMIQTGDSASRHAEPGQLLGDSPESYKIPAEIQFPALFHKRGAVAAARESDNVNPDKESSCSQFYIVYGRRFNDEMLDEAQAKLDQSTNGTVKLTPEVREEYKTHGGSPNLDGQYTV
ncbi:MAG: peptidylprolyl isomerase, partial [Prevotella sp.]|nr:peptidylprolyl isomerase [Prevotella sp.]